jgi:hypothetical protein
MVGGEIDKQHHPADGERDAIGWPQQRGVPSRDAAKRIRTGAVRDDEGRAPQEAVESV